MIKLLRGDKPPQLTPSIVAQKVAQYKAAGDAVWKDEYIASSLMSMSHNKCCYCECDLSVESNYMEVEHFHDKKHYPDEVVDWNNLLPSCKRCNVRKATHDTVKEPIVNPATEDPREHMILFRSTIFRPKDAKGRMTIEVLFLNDSDRLAPERFRISTAYAQKVGELREKADGLQKELNRSPLKVRKLVNGVMDLLQSCGPTASYSAVRSTAVLSDPLFDELKKDMNAMELWTEEMTDLELKMRGCQYAVN